MILMRRPEGRVGQRYRFGAMAAASIVAAACSGTSSSDSDLIESAETALSSPDGILSARITLNDWGGGYCANVHLSNPKATPTATWTVVINPNQSKLNNSWSAAFTVNSNQLTAKNLSYNAAVGASGVDFGFCGTATGANYAPTLVSVSQTGATAGSGGSGGSGGSAGVGGTGGSSKGGSASTGGNATGGSGGKGGTGGSGGSGTGGSTQCLTPAAPADMQRTIELTWAEMSGQFAGKEGARPQSILNHRNNIFDQVMATNGTLNYCVRWDSNATVTAQMRDQIATALERNVNEWFAKLEGYNCWPHTKIPVKVVGWAARDRNLLKWTDDSVRVYIGDIRENAPQCAEACGRFFHQQAGYTYPNCSGGIANHYDMSLWLTAGMSGGAGGDWGQRVGSEYFTGAVNNEHIHIFLHEFGHGFGFPDYYNWDKWVPTGTPVPNSVMVAGRASLVTEWDKWMLRHTYTQLKSRWR